MDDDAPGGVGGDRWRWIGDRIDAFDARMAEWFAYRLVRAVIREFKRAACMQRAGEIAFYAVVAVIPFTALLMFTVVWVTQTFAGPDWSPDDVKRVVENTLPSVLPGQQSGGMGESLAAELIDDKATLGTFGLLLMLVTSSLAFGAVNRALGAVFDVPARGRLTSIFLFSVLLSGVGLLIFIALSVIAASGTSGAEASELSEVVTAQSVVVRIGADAILLLGFGYLLRLVVHRRLRWSSIAMGAVFFVAVFEVARVVYSFYLSHIAQLSVVYGSLAGTMATILWFYYVAFMFLCALCLVRVLDDRLYDAE